jgi:hypothetical protein
MFKILIFYQIKVLIKKSHKMFLYLLLICLTVAGTGNSCQAQENVHVNNEKHSHGFHKFTGIMAFAFVDNSFSDQGNELLIVPALGLNYDYMINHKWGFGLHSDILLQQFVAEAHGSKKEIVRENPVAITGILTYKPHHRWAIMGGYGIEFEKQKNLHLIRIGAEYGIELPKEWELGFSLEFDFKPDAYNSLLFGLGFIKYFGGRAKDIHEGKKQ